MGENLYKLIKNFDDVVVMLILLHHQDATAKKSRLSRVFAEYLKSSSTVFHKPFAIFRKSLTVSFKIKRLKTGHSLLPW